MFILVVKFILRKMKTILYLPMTKSLLLNLLRGCLTTKRTNTVVRLVGQKFSADEHPYQDVSQNDSPVFQTVHG